MTNIHFTEVYAIVLKDKYMSAKVESYTSNTEQKQLENI